MGKKVILIIFSFVFLSLVSISFAANLENGKPSISFNKNSYSDTDDVEITVNAKIIQSLIENRWNDGLISLYFGQQTPNSQSILWSSEFTCPKDSLECSNKWTQKVKDIKNNKFYARVRAEIDGDIVLIDSDAYSLPTGSSSNNPNDLANRVPTVEITVDKTSVARGESVKVTVKGSDKDRNLKNIWLISNNNGLWGEWKKLKCSDTEICENTWTETESEEGTSYFGAYAQDLGGSWSEWASTEFITVKPGTVALKLSSGLNTFIIDSNFIGKSVRDFEGYAIKCDTNIRLFKSSSWEQKDRDYKFADSDKASGLVVYCAS